MTTIGLHMIWKFRNIILVGGKTHIEGWVCRYSLSLSKPEKGKWRLSIGIVYGINEENPIPMSISLSWSCEDYLLNLRKGQLQTDIQRYSYLFLIDMCWWPFIYSFTNLLNSAESNLWVVLWFNSHMFHVIINFSCKINEAQYCEIHNVLRDLEGPRIRKHQWSKSTIYNETILSVMDETKNVKAEKILITKTCVSRRRVGLTWRQICVLTFQIMST